MLNKVFKIFGYKINYTQNLMSILSMNIIYFKLLFLFILIIFNFHLYCNINFQINHKEHFSIKLNKGLFKEFTDNSLIINNNTQLLQKYFDDCTKGILYYKISNSSINFDIKISIIGIFYNEEKYLKRYVRSIQNQNFKELEIILIDDCSIDNSSTIAKNLAQEDKRIMYYRNEKNMGILYSRVLGVRKAKGEYIIHLDTDDILFPNILKKSYYILKEKNIEIGLYFRIRSGDKINPKFESQIKVKNNTIITQPELLNLRNNSIKDASLINNGNKMIKRKLFLKVIDIIGDKYLYKNLVFAEDFFLGFFIFREAKTFIYINEIGHLYYTNKKSLVYGGRIKNFMSNRENSFLNTEKALIEFSNNELDYQYAYHLLILLNSLVGHRYNSQYAIYVHNLYLNNMHYNSAQKEKIKKEIKLMG